MILADRDPTASHNIDTLRNTLTIILADRDPTASHNLLRMWRNGRAILADRDPTASHNANYTGSFHPLISHLNYLANLQAVIDSLY